MLYVNPIDFRYPAAAAKSGAKGAEAEALQEFEHLLLYKLVREMRKTVPENGLLGNSPGQRYFQEMFDDFVAGKLAESGQFGIADQMAAQMEAVKAGKKALHDRPLPEENAGTPLHPAQHGLPLHDNKPAGIPLKENRKAEIPLVNRRAWGTPLRPDKTQGNAAPAVKAGVLSADKQNRPPGGTRAGSTEFREKGQTIR
jgi:hypothetical protein